MSEFSERCKELIRDSGSNVYRLSRSTGLDRTTLQKMVSGTRLPSQDFIIKMCSALKVSKIEEKQIMELFTIEKMGKGTYFKRKMITDMIENIPDSYQNQEFTNFVSVYTLEGREGQEGLHGLSSREQIYSVAQQMIQSEIFQNKHAKIYMNYSEISDWILKAILRYESQTKGDIQLVHFLDFSKNTDVKNKEINNLEIIKTIVPFAFTFKHQYFAKYSYVSKEKDDNFYSIWPYYIVTAKCVLLFSGDLSRGIVSFDKNMISLYVQEIKRTGKEYRTLFSPMEVNEEAVQKHRELLAKGEDKRIRILESNPCIWRVLDGDVENAKFYFSLNGMKKYIKEGNVSEKYRGLIPEYTSEERQHMLLELYNDLEAGTWDGYMLNEEQLHIPEGIKIEVIEDKGVLICSMNESFNFGIIYIKEHGMCDVFMEFMEEIEGSAVVCTKKETVEKVKGIIEGGDLI